MKIKKNITLIILFISLVYSQQNTTQPIVLSIFEINNIDNELSGKNIPLFKTRLEIKIQEHVAYFQLIDPEYDKVLMESIRRALTHKTGKDLFLAGELENEDVIIKIDLYKIKKSFASTLFRCDLRMLSIKTGKYITLDAEHSDIELLAEAVAEKIFHKLWQGVVKIIVNKKPYDIFIDGDVRQKVPTIFKELKFMQGSHKIRLEKKGFRIINDEFNIVAGDVKIKNYNFIRSGAEVIINGTPDGASIVLKNKNNMFLGELPYRNMIPVGSYTLYIDHSGYFPMTEKMKVKDKKDIHISIDLPPIEFSTIRNKSLIFPGLGQYYYGNVKNGLAFIAGEVITLAISGYFANKFYQIKSDRNGNVEKYNNGIVSLHKTIRENEKDMRIYQLVGFTSFGAALGLYIYNIYDIYRYRRSFSNVNKARIEKKYNSAFDELNREINDD